MITTLSLSLSTFNIAVLKEMLIMKMLALDINQVRQDVARFISR